MLVHVLLFDSGKESEGIHSIELNGKTIVLMFENQDDAERYCLLLEAQDFPRPTIETIDRVDIEMFCEQSGYECRFVEKGFVPNTDEERLLLVPPENNRDTSSWKNEEGDNSMNKQEEEDTNNSLDEIRKKLEGLL